MLPAMLALAACGGSNPAVPAVDGPGPTGDADPTTDAPPTSSTDPANDGPYDVAVADVTIPAGGNRSAAATTYVPTAAPSPRPLVMISPGFQLGRAQYASYARHLASWGMTVIAADYTSSGFFVDHQQLADDISLEITWALAQSELAIDATEIATAGHSLGGKLSMLVAVDDPRVVAVIGWDPVDGGSAPTVAPLMGSMTAKVAVIGETTDASGGAMPCAPAASNYTTFYAAAPSPALQMTLSDADHMDWVDDPTCFACSFCTAGSAPAALARTATRRLDVAWLRRHLLGDTTMTSWLTTPPEVADGTASISVK
jgi:hypothetical protein